MNQDHSNTFPNGYGTQSEPEAPKPLFQIKKHGKLVLQFRGTFDQARGEVRKLIRQAVAKKRTVRKGMWDDISRNPTDVKRSYGYTISKVA